MSTADLKTPSIPSLGAGADGTIDYMKIPEATRG
jgi:hypothetical protein